METARLRAAADRKAVAEQRARASDLQANDRRREAHRRGPARHRPRPARPARGQAARPAGLDAPGGRRSARSARATTRCAPPGPPAATTSRPYDGPATGRAADAVKTAFAQLGDPYAWGAAGPNAFDCSGLTMYSWAAAGVSLPHSSSAQYSRGPARLGLRPAARATWSSTTARSATSASTSAAAGSSTRPTRASTCTSPGCARCRWSVPAVRSRGRRAPSMTGCSSTTIRVPRSNHHRPRRRPLRTRTGIRAGSCCWSSRWSLPSPWASASR